MTSHIPHGWRVPLIGIAAMLVIIIAVGIVVAMRDDSMDGQAVPTLLPTAEERGVATASQGEPTTTVDATPTVDDIGGVKTGSLSELLQYAPDRLSDGSLPLPFVASYADISRWMASQGVDTPTGLDDPRLALWERQLSVLSLPTSLGTRGTEPLWQETYGFNLTQVDQVLMIGAAPDSILIMRGDFDSSTLLQAWSGSGYQAVQVEGMTIWSIYPGDTIDLSQRASRPALGSLNNIVLLDDGTLVAAAKISQLQSVLRVVHGDARPLTENDDVKQLLASSALPTDERGVAVAPLMSAVIEKGDLLATLPPMVETASGMTSTTTVATGTDRLSRASTPETIVQMPEVKLVLVGLRGGSDGIPSDVATPSTVAALQSGANATPTSLLAGTPPEMVMILVMGDEDDALTAQTIVAERLATGRSTVTDRRYSDRLATPRIVTGDGSAPDDVVTIDLVLVDGADDWLRLVETRDLGFAFWEQAP